MQLEAYFQTDIGKKRTSNQDAFYMSLEQKLFLIADGMGGHKGGETASRLAKEQIPKYIQALHETNQSVTLSDFEQAIQKTNATIYEQSQTHEHLEGMGTTLTSIWFQNQSAWIGQIGDSRCYEICCEGMWQLTRDHSLVQEKLRAGLIDHTQVKTDSMKNILTRSLGFESHVQVELFEKILQDKECFLLCSDGLCSMADDEEIFKTIEDTFLKGSNLKDTCQAIIDLANEKGGEDNITVGMIQSIL